MDRNQGWEPSTTGGEMIGAPEAAQRLGLSHSYFLGIYRLIGLRPATTYNPAKRRQSLKFFVDDIATLNENPAQIREALEENKKAVTIDPEAGRRVTNPAA